MTTYVRANGSHKVVYQIWQKVAGVWKECPLVTYKLGGTWRVVHEKLVPFVFVDNITGTIYNYNLRDRALAAGWNPIVPLHATVNMTNCTVAALFQNSYAFTTGITFKDGSFLNLNVDANSRIIGKGGKGGRGGDTVIASQGLNGNPAVFISLPTNLDNLGTIAGGGGGSGAGGHQTFFNTLDGKLSIAGGYAGAGGAGLGVGGLHGICTVNGSTTDQFSSVNEGRVITQATGSPVDGSLLVGGVARGSWLGSAPYAGRVVEWYTDIGTNDTVYVFDIIGGGSGTGGALGNTGTTGETPNAILGNETIYAGSLGGNGGRAIVGISYVTVINAGTLLGGTE